VKKLDNVTLVNGLHEIYQLFTQLYPELVPQVKEWHQWSRYTDTFRGLAIQLHNGGKLLFSIQKYDGEEGWCVPGCYMVPSYVSEVPETVADSTSAMNISPLETPEELLDIFCRMFPDYQSEVMSFKIWRRFGPRFRGIMIDLRDRRRVLFSAKKNRDRWDAAFPILVPSPDEEDVPLTDIDKIIMSEMLIIL